MPKKRIIAGVVLVTAFSVANLNHWMANQPLQAVIAGDTRNEGVQAWGYYRHLVNPKVIVLDLRDLSPTNSRLDVSRTLLQYAEALKERDLSHVVLAYRGEARFRLEGDYFRQLGHEYAFQNPTYTLRTLDGRRAYPEWRGGLIGVLGRQMEDHNRFHDDWYLSDMLAR